MPKHLYFDRSLLGYTNTFKVYVGPNPDAQCLLALELCKRFHYDLIIYNEYYEDHLSQCPLIFLNDKLIGGFEDLREIAGQQQPNKQYIPRSLR